MELVSVLIPAFNVEEFIEEAVDSIINQSYSNLEIIIVDDCSEDRTFEILKSLEKRDSRIKLFRNSENMRIAKTLNIALSKANGEYIARMDGDDISLPDRIEKKVAFLEEHKEYDLVGSSVKSIDEKGNVLGHSKYYSNYDLLCSSIKYTNPMSHIWVARQKVYKELKGYREISGCEDYDFILRMTSEGYKYTNLEDYYGYCVRIRGGNTNDWLGLKQRKMHDYVYNLYQERNKYGHDTFSEENLEKALDISKINEKLYNFSSQMLVKAIKSKASNNYFNFSIYSLLCLVSPHKIKYIYYKIIFKLRIAINLKQIMND